MWVTSIELGKITTGSFSISLFSAENKNLHLLNEIDVVFSFVFPSHEKLIGGKTRKAVL